MNFSTNITALFLIFAWMAGIVIAKGFWQTLFSFFPLYSWYLLTEHVMKLTHFIN